MARYYGFMLDVLVSVSPSVVRPSICPSAPLSVFRFLMITSKHQWIVTKLGIGIDSEEIWFGIANGQISSNFTGLSACDTIMAGYYSLTFLFFFQIRFDISCKLSPKDTCLKCQTIWDLLNKLNKNKKAYFKMFSAEIFIQYAGSICFLH